MKITEICDFSCDRFTTCCITGHRNRDLPFGGDLHKQGMKCLVSMLHLLVEEAYKDGYRTFISGMADGIDLTCAEIVYDMKKDKHHNDMRLVCALPYAQQIAEISDPFQSYKYSMILAGCDEKIIVSTASDKNRYKSRNQFMVDNSSRIIGAFKQKERGSGTLQTINMAKKALLEINIISLDKNPVLYTDTDNENWNEDFYRFVP